MIEKKIQTLLNKKDQVVIAMDGMAASGKSTFAKGLAKHFRGTIIHMDDFFLQDHQRIEQRLNEVGGFVDYERFYEEVIKPLMKGKLDHYHAYDCQDKTMTKIDLNPSSLYIIEGAYAMRPDFIGLYDLSILWLIDSKEQKRRIKTRSPHLLQAFVNEWIPKENSYIEYFNLEDKADIVIEIAS